MLIFEAVPKLRNQRQPFRRRQADNFIVAQQVHKSEHTRHRQGRQFFKIGRVNFQNPPNATFTAEDSNLNLVFNAAGQQTNQLFGTVNSKIRRRTGQVALKFYF